VLCSVDHRHEQLAGYGSMPGAIGLAAQIVFATFPLVEV
jgi:hypothetical protein